MRSSSIKSLVITAATVAAISLTTVPVNARPAQSTQPVASAPQARENGAVALIKRLYNRFIGPMLNSTLSVPLPAPEGSTLTSGIPAAGSDS
ncbi:MAG TPA: hypothetical protein VE974_09445 [Thermoanaerobaculia bacterium]|nr:hypothetical protein [Thermoanaerobaculia bacterium]